MVNSRIFIWGVFVVASREDARKATLEEAQQSTVHFYFYRRLYKLKGNIKKVLYTYRF